MTVQSRFSLQFLLAILCFAIAALALFALLGQLDINSLMGGRLEWAIILFGVIASLVIFWWTRRRGKTDIFEFPTWITINIFSQAILSVWLFYDRLQAIYPSLRSNFEVWLLQALFLISGGLLFLWMGYSIILSRLIHRRVDRITSNRVLNLRVASGIWIILWSFLSISAFVNFLGWGGVAIGTWSNYLAFFQLLFMATSGALLIYHFRNPSLLGWIWLVIGLSTSILNGVAIGSRGAVLYIVYVFILAYYATGQYKWRWIVVGILTLLILAPAASLLRTQLPRYSSVNPQDRLGVTFKSIQSIMAQPVGKVYSQVVDLYARRQGGLFLITASVVRQHPGIRPFVGDELFSEFLVGLVPRIFWLSKPIGVSKLYSISTTYADAPTEATFSEIGIFADTYRVGGWPFLAIFLFLVGVFMGWLYYRGPFINNDYGIVLYFLLLIIIAYNRPFLEICLFLVQRFILLWLFIFFVLYRRNNTMRSNS